MSVYQIVIMPAALRVLASIARPQQERIRAAIQALAKQPRPMGHVKLKGLNLYRIRVGDYRVIYEVADRIITVTITEIGNRREVYQRLRRR